MDRSQRGALVGAVGGAGATLGGMIGVYLSGDFLLASLLAIGAACMLAGVMMVYLSSQTD